MDNNNLDSRLDEQNENENNLIPCADEGEMSAMPDAEEKEAATEPCAEENEDQNSSPVDEVAEETDTKSSGGRLKAVVSALYDYAEVFAISIVAVIVIFSFGLKLCRVDGHSMKETLHDGELLIAQDFFYTPKQGDIVVFHVSNNTFHRPLVKRVIATEGQLVQINFTDKLIIVDGIIYSDENAYLSGDKYEIKFDFDKEKMYSMDGKVYYAARVPEGMLFVLGDNRNNSTDSRSVNLGFVDADCVLGKAVLRLNPFTIFD